MCFNRAPPASGSAIFGFAEFITALALLVVVFNSGDFLYKFRISVAALPLRTITFVSAVVIGAGTLLTDVWFSERWYSPAWGVPRATIQAAFAALFLATVLSWIWVAFIRPPTFSRWNFKHFHAALFHAVVRGSDAQLPIIAAELAYSAAALVRMSKPRGRQNQAESQQKPGLAEYAAETLVILGNRKLCRHIVASAPGTAIQFMQEAINQQRWNLPLGEFAHNITTEAILNKDSSIYHEDDLYNWDVVGRMQPFSRAMYGNYRLVQGLSSGAHSPLDIDWRVAWKMDGEQFSAYCRIVLLTFKDYIDGRHYHSHSTALYRAFDIISDAGRNIYKLENAPVDSDPSDVLARLDAAVHFVTDAIKHLGEAQNLDIPPFKPHDEKHHRGSIFDHIAKLMYDLIHSAAYVRGPVDRAWLVHYNTVWGRLFSFQPETRAWRAVRRRLFRLLFDELKKMEKWPNYQGARILGFLLNVEGLTPGDRKGYRSEEHPLRRAVIGWAKRNYMGLVEANPELADYALSGGISFDSENRRLVKTYAKGTRREPHREYLELDAATSPLGEE